MRNRVNESKFFSYFSTEKKNLGSMLLIGKSRQFSFEKNEKQIE